MTPEELKSTMDQARELLSDIRGATKDLRAAKREVEDWIVCIVRAQVTKIIEERVKAELEALGRVTKTEMAKSVAKVTAEFDRLENILLGKERDDDQPSIEELIRRRQQ